MSIFSFIILFIILSTKTAVFPLPAAAATNIFEPFSFIACDCSFVIFSISPYSRYFYYSIQNYDSPYSPIIASFFEVNKKILYI